MLIAIPSSLCVTLTTHEAFGFTIDTVSLLAMTLIIGILVDDSIVVLENIGRHYDDGEAPRTAAILGRSEIGNAAIVITLVDVVVFLPIAFLPGIVGRFLARVRSRRRCRDAHVAGGLVHDHAGAGRQLVAALEAGGRRGFIDAFTRGFDAVARASTSTRVLVWALAPPAHRRRRLARSDVASRWR